MNEWLNRQTAWRYAFIAGSLTLVLALIGDGIVFWVTSGHMRIGFWIGYAVVVAVGVSIGAALSRRRLQRRRTSIRD
jgi:hypothetical protein